MCVGLIYTALRFVALTICCCLLPLANGRACGRCHCLSAVLTPSNPQFFDKKCVELFKKLAYRQPKASVWANKADKQQSTRAHTHFRPESTRDANDRQHIFFGITKKQKIIVHEIIWYHSGWKWRRIHGSCGRSRAIVWITGSFAICVRANKRL